MARVGARHVARGRALDEDAAGQDWPAAIERAEHVQPDVLLGCDAASSAAWREFCRRTATASSSSAPRRMADSALAGCHTVGAVVVRGQRWPRWAEQLPLARRARLESDATPTSSPTADRRLARTRALRRGCAGLAHLGVLRELEQPSCGRTGGRRSMGAFIGALAQAGSMPAGSPTCASANSSSVARS